MPDFWIGCSGFYYKEWKEEFYPKNVAQARWFEYYCTHFNTLELNNTFYRFPKIEALQSWYRRSPENFKFSVKAPRLITHYKTFVDCKGLLQDFYTSTKEGFADKLGCVLFQLPPKLVYSVEVMARIITSLDSSFNNIVEFRDDSWWNTKIYSTLKDHKISFCGISHPTLKDDVIRNNELLYYRFHGVPVLYKSEYPEDYIQQIANEIKASEFIDAYIYFNNTWGTGALTNARQLQGFLSL